MKIQSPKKTVAKKAVKTTAKHTAKGTVSKVRRQPLRSATLLGAGAFAGLVVGYLLGSRGSRQESPAEQPSTESPTAKPSTESSAEQPSAESPAARAEKGTPPVAEPAGVSATG